MYHQGGRKMKLNLILKSLAAVAAVSASVAQAQSFNRSFAPENDLWMEDNLEATGGITKEVFNQIIDVALEVYTPLAKQNNERLQVNRKWDDSTVNANVRRSGGVVEINMFGGLARRSEVTPDGFALVLCHELGHAYGGTPYIQAASRLSAEGQADYYGNGACMDNVTKKLQVDLAGLGATKYMAKRCAEKNEVNSPDYNTCIRELTAGQSLGNLLSTLMKEKKAPDYETPDPTVVPSTLTSYPKTVQCRLDTYFAGAMDLARPACWFKK
jgi:hypothetical protein